MFNLYKMSVSLQLQFWVTYYYKGVEANEDMAFIHEHYVYYNEIQIF